MKRAIIAAAATTLTASLSLTALAAAAAEPKPPVQAGRPDLKTRPSGDKEIIYTVTDAMGFVRSAGGGTTTNTINRVQLRGSGKVTEGGVAYKADTYIYTISLSLKAAREDITRSAGKTSDRVVRVVLDKDAWDEAEPGIDGKATSESALNRRLQLARTPFGFTRALIDAPAGSVKVTDPGPKGKVTLAFPIEGVMTTTVLNAEYRPETITMVVDGKTLQSRFPAYHDVSEYGLMFPTRWIETIDGKTRLDVVINDGRVASYAVFPKPASLATAAR